MKKIAFITLGRLPVPATRGGAVENLLQLLLDENEHAHAFDATVFSVSEPKAVEESRKYRFSKFVFIPATGKIWRALRILRSALNRFVLPFYIGNQFAASVIRELKRRGNDFDALVLEGVPEYSIPLRRAFPKSLIISRLHNRYIFNGCSREKAIVEATDVFLGVSEYICRETRTARGVAPENVYCCYNGIDTGRFSRKISAEERDALRERLGFAPTDFVFVFSGRLVKEKGVGELIEAFSAAEKTLRNAKLLILGGKAFAGTAADWERPRSRNVVFSGYIPYAEMPLMLQCADAAVLPSIWEEPFAPTFAEALCAGLPAIVTDSGGMVEIAENSGATIVPRGENFVPRLAEAMCALAGTPPTERERLSAQAAARGAYFSKERCFDRFCEILEKIPLLNR